MFDLMALAACLAVVIFCGWYLTRRFRSRYVVMRNCPVCRGQGIDVCYETCWFCKGSGRVQR